MIRNVWAGQVRPGHVIVDDGLPPPDNEYTVVRVMPLLGGSFFDVYVAEFDEPICFGRSEKVPVKS